MDPSHRLARIARYAWAAPCSLVGLVVAIPVLALGGSARIKSGVLEVIGSARGRPARARFDAITFGHIVVGRNERVLDELDAHERAHVRQYERWGVLFFVAYPVSSLVQVLRGRGAYRSNHFEVQARDECTRDPGRYT